MNYVVVAVANLEKPEFAFNHVQLPVSDSTMLACLRDAVEAQKLVTTARFLMGIPADAEVVSLIHCPLLDHSLCSFDEFIAELKRRHTVVRVLRGFFGHPSVLPPPAPSKILYQF